MQQAFDGGQRLGPPRLVEAGAQLAVPAHERFLFARSSEYWQQKRIYDNYNDRSTFNSLGEDLPVAASLEDYETFEWGSYRLEVQPAPGHTLGIGRPQGVVQQAPETAWGRQVQVVIVIEDLAQGLNRALRRQGGVVQALVGRQPAALGLALQQPQPALGHGQKQRGGEVKDLHGLRR